MTRPLDDLFAEAMRVPEGPEREAWITAACGGDHRLRDEIRKLIAAHESAESFLSTPLVEGRDQEETEGPRGESE